MYSNNYENIVKEIITLLGNNGINAYTILPDNISFPYVFVGPLQFQEDVLKDRFLLKGYFSVAIRDVGDSIKPLLNLSDNVVNILKPTKPSKLLNFIYLKMISDTGAELINPNKKMYSRTITFEFQLIEPMV